MTSPYAAKQVEYARAVADFDYFATNAPAILTDALKRNPRGIVLEQYNSFLVKRASNETVQAWFGKRPTGRPAIGYPGMDAEIGAQLLYSLGPTGHVAAILHPAKSTRAQVQETFLLLGHWRPDDLAAQADDHIRALIAYTHVSSLDGSPTLQERALVRWLRLVCLTEKNGTQGVEMGAIAKSLAAFGMRGLFAGLMRMLLLMGSVALLAYLGYRNLGDFISRHI